MDSKTAFVTGASSGIGKAIAKGLAENGYDVAFSYFGNKEGAKETEKIIESLGRRPLAVRADMRNIDDINMAFARIENEFSHLDVYVNNAGVTEKCDFLHTSPKLFDSIVLLDYRGAFFCMQAAAKLMVKNHTKGSIVLISSNNAKAHFADVSVYGSAKAAAQKAAQHAAIELAAYGIRVNTISPGWTDTGAARLDEKESTYYKIPLGKWVDVDEIADAVIYLSSKSARSVTGAEIIIDNGALLQADKHERYGF